MACQAQTIMTPIHALPGLDRIELPNEYLKKRIEETIVKFQSLHIGEAIIQETKKYFLAQENHLKLSFQTISDYYGDFQTYLKKIGIDENATAKLFDIYTE